MASKKFDIAGFAMKLGAMTAGLIAAKMADPLLEKAKINSKTGGVIKMGVGAGIGFFVKNDLAQAAGLGFAAQGAYSVAYEYMPALHGIGGAVYGVGSTYMTPALPNYTDEVSGIFPEGDIIGANNYGEEVGRQYTQEEEVQATLGLV